MYFGLSQRISAVQGPLAEKIPRITVFKVIDHVLDHFGGRSYGQTAVRIGRMVRKLSHNWVVYSTVLGGKEFCVEGSIRWISYLMGGRLRRIISVQGGRGELHLLSQSLELQLQGDLETRWFLHRFNLSGRMVGVGASEDRLLDYDEARGLVDHGAIGVFKHDLLQPLIHVPAFLASSHSRSIALRTPRNFGRARRFNPECSSVCLGWRGRQKPIRNQVLLIVFKQKWCAPRAHMIHKLFASLVLLRQSHPYIRRTRSCEVYRVSH